MSLRSKITWSILLLILFFGSLASYTTYFLTKKEFTTQVSKDLHGNTIALSHEIYQIMRQSRDIAKAISHDTLVRSYLSNPNPSQSQKEVILDEFSGYNLGDMYSAIFILDHTGKTLISTDPRFEEQDYGTRDYYLNAISGTPYATSAIGVTSKELGYYFSSPIFDPKDETKITGVTVAKLKPKFIETALLNHLSTGYDIYLTDRHGIIILPSDSDKYLRSLGPLDQSSLDELVTHNTYDKTEFSALGYGIFMNEIKNGLTNSKIVQIKDIYDNKDELIAISKVEDFPFYIMFEGDMTVIDSISIRSSLVIAGYVLIAAVLSVIIVLIVVQIFLNQQQITEQKLLEKTNDLEILNKLMVGRELKMIELKKQLADKS
jgi:C4-dicarboxylate-specific signal transduction histidine kinase